MAEQKHQIIIEGKGRGLKEIRKDLSDAKNDLIKSQNEFGKFSKQAQDAGARITKFSNELRQANTSIKQFGVSSKMSGLQLLEMGENLTVVAAGIRAAIQPFIDFGKQVITTGADLQVLKSNFQGSTEDILNFRKATAGTVTDANLIKLSNQATDLGIGLKEQTILFSFAENVADKYATTTEDGFQRVFTVLNGGTKGLKDFGIEKSQFIKRTEELSKSLGVEIDEQIRLQALIELSGETFDSATNKVKDNKDIMDSVTVSYANFKAELGDNIVEFFGNQVKDATSALNNFGVSTEDASGFLSQFTSKFTDHIGILIRAILPWTNLVTIFKDVSERLKSITKSAKDTNTALGSITSTLSKAVPTTLIDIIQDALESAKQSLREFLYLIGVLGAEKGGTAFGGKKLTPDNTKPPTKKSPGTKQGTTNIEERQLNFLEQFRENVKKIEAEIASLNSQLNDSNLLEFEKLAIQDELIKKQKELNELKRVNLGLTAQEITGSILGTPSLQFGSARSTPMGQSIFSQGEQDTNEAIQREINELLDNIQNAFSGVLDFSQSILNHFGMADSVMADIVNKLSSLFGIAQKGISVIETIAGIFSGGGGVAGMSYSGGGGVLVANISLKSELERDKMVRAVVRVTPEVNYMLNQKNVN